MQLERELLPRKLAEVQLVADKARGLLQSVLHLPPIYDLLPLTSCCCLDVAGMHVPYSAEVIRTLYVRRLPART